MSEAGVVERVRAAEVEPERGSWRAVFSLASGELDADMRAVGLANGWKPFGDDWLAPKAWPSEAAAARYGDWAERQANIANAFLGNGIVWRFLRAEFFPEYA